MACVEGVRAGIGEEVSRDEGGGEVDCKYERNELSGSSGTDRKEASTLG